MYWNKYKIIISKYIDNYKTFLFKLELLNQDFFFKKKYFNKSYYEKF